MTIEEKAKAYDEVVRLAKNIYANPDTSIDVKDHLVGMIPELAESEDEKIRNFLIEKCNEGHWPERNIFKKEQAIAWLEKQKEHNVCGTCDEQASCVTPCPLKLVEQKPAGWSEEDEDNINTVCDIIEHSTTIPYIGGTLIIPEDYKKELISWLKSLRPQPHWKPSEEQMEALKKVIDGLDITRRTQVQLESLYEDFKTTKRQN